MEVPFDRYTATLEDVSRVRLYGQMRRMEWDFRLRKNFDGYESKYNSRFKYMGAMSSCLNNVVYDITNKTKIIDAGCGDSPDCEIALHMGAQRAVGLDLLPCEKDKKEFIQTDIVEKWPFREGSFDIVLSQAVIDLIDPVSRISFYSEAYRALRKGGIFAILMQKLSQGWGFHRDTEIQKIENAGFRNKKHIWGGIQFSFVK